MTVRKPNIQQRYITADGTPTIEAQIFFESLVRAIETLELLDTGNDIETLPADVVAALALVTAQQLGWLGAMTPFGASLIDDADPAEAQGTLGVEPGVDVQGYSVPLTSIDGLTTSGGEMIYTTAADTYATSTITAAGRALMDDADAAAQRATLGLTDAAVAVFQTGLEWDVTISDESGNDSPTTVRGVYQRFGNVIYAGFSDLNNIDTTGLVGTDDVLISIPAAWAGYVTGNLAVASMTGTTPYVPFGETPGSTIKIVTSQGGAALTVSQMTDDAADIRQCGLMYSLVGVAVNVTADTTTYTADTTVLTADIGIASNTADNSADTADVVLITADAA